MIMRLLACTVVGALSAAPALADQNTAGVVRDARIRYLGYGENNVYRLDLYLKSVSAVQFADDEQVESILIGDSASWEVVKLKNGHVISVKAIIPLAATNMTVYTDRRVYTFELHSLGEFAAGKAPPPYRSVFTYPAKKKVANRVAVVQPEIIDSSYMVSGEAEFRPVWVQDNGRQTSFFLPENAPRPAIFKVGAKKDEQLINSRTIGSRVVVDGVSDYWVLRIGDKVVCIAHKRAIKTTSRFSIGQGGKHAG